MITERSFINKSNAQAAAARRLDSEVIRLQNRIAKCRYEEEKKRLEYENLIQERRTAELESRTVVEEGFWVAGTTEGQHEVTVIRNRRPTSRGRHSHADPTRGTLPGDDGERGEYYNREDPPPPVSPISVRSSGANQYSIQQNPQRTTTTSQLQQKVKKYTREGGRRGRSDDMITTDVEFQRYDSGASDRQQQKYYQPQQAVSGLLVHTNHYYNDTSYNKRSSSSSSGAHHSRLRGGGGKYYASDTTTQQQHFTNGGVSRVERRPQTMRRSLGIQATESPCSNITRPNISPLPTETSSALTYLLRELLVLLLQDDATVAKQWAENLQQSNLTTTFCLGEDDAEVATLVESVMQCVVNIKSRLNTSGQKVRALEEMLASSAQVGHLYSSSHSPPPPPHHHHHSMTHQQGPPPTTTSSPSHSRRPNSGERVNEKYGITTSLPAHNSSSSSLFPPSPLSPPKPTSPPRGLNTSSTSLEGDEARRAARGGRSSSNRSVSVQSSPERSPSERGIHKAEVSRSGSRSTSVGGQSSVVSDRTSSSPQHHRTLLSTGSALVSSHFDRTPPRAKVHPLSPSREGPFSPKKRVQTEVSNRSGSGKKRRVEVTLPPPSSQEAKSALGIHNASFTSSSTYNSSSAEVGGVATVMSSQGVDRHQTTRTTTAGGSSSSAVSGWRSETRSELEEAAAAATAYSNMDQSTPPPNPEAPTSPPSRAGSGSTRRPENASSSKSLSPSELLSTLSGSGGSSTAKTSPPPRALNIHALSASAVSSSSQRRMERAGDGGGQEEDALASSCGRASTSSSAAIASTVSPATSPLHHRSINDDKNKLSMLPGFSLSTTNERDGYGGSMRSNEEVVVEDGSFNSSSAMNNTYSSSTTAPLSMSEIRRQMYELGISSTPTSSSASFADTTNNDNTYALPHSAEGSPNYSPSSLSYQTAGQTTSSSAGVSPPKFTVSAAHRPIGNQQEDFPVAPTSPLTTPKKSVPSQPSALSTAAMSPEERIAAAVSSSSTTPTALESPSRDIEFQKLVQSVIGGVGGAK